MGILWWSYLKKGYCESWNTDDADIADYRGFCRGSVDEVREDFHGYFFEIMDGLGFHFYE